MKAASDDKSKLTFMCVQACLHTYLRAHILYIYILYNYIPAYMYDMHAELRAVQEMRTHTHLHTYVQTGRQAGKQTGRQTASQTDRHTDKQTCMHACMHTSLHTHTHT